MAEIRILGVHGLGDHRTSDWKEQWERAIRDVLPERPGVELAFDFVTYDPIFEETEVSAWDTAKALWKLSSSAVTSTFRLRKGVVDRVADRVRWTAGYVVAWVEDESFQRKSRKLILEAIGDLKPQVLLGHSLGSLVTYNALTHADADGVKDELGGVHYVTLGSQIANPFVVRNLTPGRIVVPPVRFWHHLYNEEDDVFTAPIRIFGSDRFRQVDTPFDDKGFADHTATRYLTHPAAVDSLWGPIVDTALAPRARPRPSAAAREKGKRPARDRSQGCRALLVGINDYPNPGDRLEGCVNDVFRMSEVLQECGFPPSTIRVCLDGRATAEGILERLEWLLDDPRPGDERVFYFSGHGAQIPEYGEENEPDRLLETLVPHDFDWSPEHAITDDQIYHMYSQLPFDLRLAMIFDCCHSGGIHRAGAPRARGIDPPDDIRHREIEWNAERQMWVPRGFTGLNRNFARRKADAERFFGASGAVARLGRASAIRGQSEAAYRRMKKARGDSRFGPYLPLVIQACGEEQLAYEYRHGVTSFGAFTYSLTTILREQKRVSFEKLVELATVRLEEIEYLQKPVVLGPSTILAANVPWIDWRAS